MNWQDKADYLCAAALFVLIPTADWLVDVLTAAVIAVADPLMGLL